jgi:mono/diheme cytochrome c family protein
MISHFDLALEARGAALWGDVAEFRRFADQLAQLEPARDLPAEIILQLGPMRWEAREGAKVSTPQAATVAAARIAQTCGECHQANDVGLGERFTLGGPPPEGSPARHMAGLAWASRLLWDGLVGPSDRTWFTGAEGLIELGVLPEGLPASLPRDEVDAAGVRLRELGRRATASRDTESRVALLGEIWTTCAGCHVATR